MTKEYTSLGLMSGTSGDGVDASIIRSDGETKYKVILDKYFKYNQDIYKNIHNLKNKINNSKDLENLSKECYHLWRYLSTIYLIWSIYEDHSVAVIFANNIEDFV